jgi:hypothetical protein
MRIAPGIRFAPEMIASSDHAAHFIDTEAGGRHDRIPDRARTGGPRRHSRVGGFAVSARIIQFTPPRKHQRVPTGFSRLAFRSTARPDNAVADHGDTSPCEYFGENPEEIRIEDG